MELQNALHNRATTTERDYLKVFSWPCLCFVKNSAFQQLYLLTYSCRRGRRIQTGRQSSYEIASLPTTTKGNILVVKKHNDFSARNMPKGSRERVAS